MKPKPICAQCGKAYGQRATEMIVARCPRGEQLPPYEGDGIVVKADSGFLGGKERLEYRYIWDGMTYWTPHKPFCTLRCALAYAREAYADELKRREP